MKENLNHEQEMSGPFKLLIVEDSMDVVERIVEMVQETLGSLIVEIASNADDTFKLIDIKKPDALILDIQLGKDENGMDLLKAVRRNYKNMTVIMFTNFSGADFRQMCIEMGADYFLDKTMDFDKLPDILKRLTDSKC